MTTATAEVFDPQLLQALRAAPWKTIEKRFLVILAASIAAHIGFATYIAAQPAPAWEAFEEPMERGFQAQKLPPLVRIPNIPNLPVKSASAPSKTTAAPAKTPGEQRAVAKQAVEKVFGGGAMLEIVGAPATDFAKAMDGVQAPATYYGNVGPAGPRGPAVGEAQTVAPIGTEGVKQVSLGTKLEAKPRAEAGPIEVDPTDELDPRLLQKFIAARRAAVTSCFERELLHNPGMVGGKVAIRIVIGTTGRVVSAAVNEDTLRSDAVNACMTSTMKRWVFPVSPADDVPVVVPFVFARAS